jgi:phosphate transport system ATP-binding protein
MSASRLHCGVRPSGTRLKDDLLGRRAWASGGQQQRLYIAGTVAIEPDVILLDEPCSALDPITTAKIEETINELKVDHTIAIITHNMEQAGRISDNAGFMYLDALLEFDSSHNIFTSPQNVQTQRYITGRFG